MKYGLLPGCQNSSGCGRDYSQQWASLGKENLPSTPTLLKIDQLYLSQYLQGSMHYFTQISVSPRRVRVSQDMLLDRYWCCVIHSTVCTVLRCPRTTTWNLLLDFPSHPFWAAWAPCILQCVSWRRLKKPVLLFLFVIRKTSESHSIVSDSLRPRGLYIYGPWDSPGQNSGVGSLSLLQGIFPTQGENTGLPHCRRVLYQLSHKGKHTPNKIGLPASG